MGHRWADFVDGVPTMNQHWVNPRRSVAFQSIEFEHVSLSMIEMITNRIRVYISCSVCYYRISKHAGPTSVQCLRCLDKGADYFLLKPWRLMGFFQFAVIINDLDSSFRFIRLPMLWVYSHYNKYFYSFSAGIDFGRQNLTSTIWWVLFV